MDLPVWILLATLLLVTAQANPSEPQTVNESKSPQKQHKRQPSEEPSLPLQSPSPAPHLAEANKPHYVMKEVIMYLTPTQIKSLQDGKGHIELQRQPNHHNFEPKLVQNAPQDDKNLEKDSESKRLQEAVASSSANKENKLEASSAPHLSNEISQKLQQELKDQLELQHQQLQNHHPGLQYQFDFQHQPQLQLHQELKFQPEFQHHPQLQLLPEHPQLHLSHPPAPPPLHLQRIPQHSQQEHHEPFFYALPQIKPIGSENLQEFHNEHQHETHPDAHDFKLIPYAYTPESELEAKKLLLANIEKQLEPFRLQPHQLDFGNLDPQHLEAITRLTAQHFHQNQHIEGAFKHEDTEQAHQHQAQLESHQLEVGHSFENHYPKEHELFEAQKLAESTKISQQLAEIHGVADIPEPAKTPQLADVHDSSKVHFFPEPQALAGFQNNNHEKTLEPEELHASKELQIKEIIEAHKLKARLQAQEKEAEKLDAELKQEEIKVQDLKEEQHRLLFIRGQKNLLQSLVQYQNILDPLKEPVDFIPPKLEKGFEPVDEWSPKENKEKYDKEIKKILLENQLEKQKALAQVAAIANEPPVVVKEETVKHIKIPVPAPYIVRVPEPYEVKVPQPYPVPLEIVRHVPYEVVKVEKVEVEKPVPIEVEKHVPYPVEKKVYVKVDRPYFVERIVPVPVNKKIPIPVRSKPQKFSIIKHVSYS